jgi:hypothetical protein
MFIDLGVELAGGGTLYERNPQARPDTPTHEVSRVMMGDIVRTGDAEATLSFEVGAHAGIERIEIRNGLDVLETIRPYGESDLGRRVRVLWSGAEYRGRGRNTTWRGRARVTGARIERFETINLWNPERLFEQRGSDTIVFDTVTTGNFMGFDAWLSDTDSGRLQVTTNHGDLDLDLAQIGLEDTVLEAGGLARRLKVMRMPDERLGRNVKIERKIPLKASGDNPIWIAVTTEDGYQAWTSPVYLIR